MLLLPFVSCYCNYMYMQCCYKCESLSRSIQVPQWIMDNLIKPKPQEHKPCLVVMVVVGGGGGGGGADGTPR